ncbi:phage minor capsid protein, partial [Streptomyces sp. NPDC097640]|uniref:phage minor capsid protein n=1 Tax=Streptomyces sp. NPDC097640 TaxID=3157229 RepID=UPI0033203EB9
MRQFTDRGIGSFTDKANRTRPMTTYAETAIRTSTGHASVEAHADWLLVVDLGLVVSDDPHECSLYAPGEGKILALDGPDGARTAEAEHAVDDGRTVRVRAAGNPRRGARCVGVRVAWVNWRRRHQVTACRSLWVPEIVSPELTCWFDLSKLSRPRAVLRQHA